MYFSDNLDLSQKDGGDDNVVIRSGRVFTVPRDKILPYFKGFRQDEYPTTFPLLLLQSTWGNMISFKMIFKVRITGVFVFTKVTLI